jgi:hypothetical protein
MVLLVMMWSTWYTWKEAVVSVLGTYTARSKKPLPPLESKW